MNIKHIILTALLSALPFVGSTLAQDHGDHAKGSEEKAAWVFEGDAYLLDIDVVTGKALGPLKDQVVIDFEGRELRFSSAESVKTFKADPKPLIAKIDALMVADQVALYPLMTCPISGEKLGSMGAPIDLIHKNRLVRLCCKGCLKKFRKDSSAQIAKLNAAVMKQQAKDYPLTVCPVSGEKLGSMGDPIERVVGGRLVRLCCKGCLKKLAKDPLKFTAQVDAARAANLKRAKASK